MTASDTATAHNHFRLTAELTQRDSLRYTPAGIEAIDVQLTHSSRQHEAVHDSANAQSSPRTVALQLQAVAFGSLANRLDRTALGTTLALKGFLAQTARGKRIVFHIQAIDLLLPAPSAEADPD